MEHKEKSLVCSIDIGTSSIRVSAYGELSRLIDNFFVQEYYQMQTTLDGGVEIHSEILFEIVSKCLDLFLEKVNQQNYSIVAVGVSTFWHSLLGLDSKSRPLTPLISWNDTRSTLAAKHLKNNLDELEIHQNTGCRLHASYWPAKISWLLTTNVELVKKVSKWVSFADYVFLKLFGQLATSISLASGTGLLNRNSCFWDEKIISNLPIEITKLPDIVERPFYGLRKDFAKRWPKLAKIPWFLPVGDGACSNIGSDCFNSSRFALMIGTSGAMRAVCENINFPIPSGLWCYKIDKKRSVIGGAMSNAGNLFAWLKQTLILPDSEDILEEELSKIAPDSHGLTMLPFFSGERSIGWHDNAKGAILGLQMASKPIDLLCAGLEAIAYQFFLIYQELSKVLGAPNEIVATGGGLYNSKVWGKIIADVLGQNLSLSNQQEASSRGAALLALEALGILKLEQNNTFDKIYSPNLENKLLYEQALKRYQDFYEKLVLGG